MIVTHHKGSYEIMFGALPKLSGPILADSNVAHIYQLTEAVTIPAGEASKSLAEYSRLASLLLQQGVTRKSHLVAVGGGVTGDLVGFLAATLLRGIPFTQVPTTLLAMVDSSVGGKVGIDVPEGKNLLGAFHPPAAVFIDPAFLKTLPEREHQSGMAEALKHGLIRNSELLSQLHQRPLDQPLEANLIEEAVKVKVEVVEADEFETQGIRAQLNAGHTLAHALEQVLNYENLLHGEAVAIGLAVETELAESLGLAKPGTAKTANDVLLREGLPITHPALINPEPLLAAMKRDKKSTGEGIAFSFVLEPGTCKLVTDVRAADVAQFLRQR